MQNKWANALLVVISLVAASFALIYTVDYSLLVFGFSVNKRVPLDWLRFGVAVMLLAVFEVSAAHFLRPRGRISFVRRPTLIQRLVVSTGVVCVLAIVIWGVWLATEL